MTQPHGYPEAPHRDHVWECDTFTLTLYGFAMQALVIVDAFTHECVALHVATSIDARRVQSELESVFRTRKPQSIRFGRAFLFQKFQLLAWLTEEDVTPASPAKLWGCLLAERLLVRLNRAVFQNPPPVKELEPMLKRWVTDYNASR